MCVYACLGVSLCVPECVFLSVFCLLFIVIGIHCYNERKQLNF